MKASPESIKNTAVNTVSMQGKITLLSIQTKIRPVLRQNAFILYFITISFLFSFQPGRFAFENSIFRNGTAHHIFHSGNLIHHFCHDLFNNRTEPAGTRIPFDGFLRDGTNRFLLKTSSTLSIPRSF